MKRLLYILLLTLPLITNAQIESFTGIGVFKIGTDTTTLIQNIKSSKGKIKTINNDSQYLSAEFSKDLVVYRLYQDKKNKSYLMNLDYCPEVVEYLVTGYEVSGIKLSKIRLQYYHNKLIKFSCDHSNEIDDAIDVKYGKIPVEISHDTSTCVYNLTGAERKLVGDTYKKSQSFGDIKLLSMSWKSFDDHCKETYGSLFYYEINDPDKNECSSAGLLQSTQPKVDKTKLKDF